MNWRNIGIVYRKELLDSMRDRRTLISMIVVPVLVIPLLMLGMGLTTAKVVMKARKDIPRVMIVGGSDSPKILHALQQLDTIKVVPESADYTNQIAEKTIRAAARIPPGFDEALRTGSTSAVQVYVYEGEMKSTFAAQNVLDFLHEYRDRTVRDRLAARNLPDDLLKPFSIDRQNVAPPRKVTGNILGGILPYIVILLSLLGAMYPAMDLTAGEKERGTMETILCSPVLRPHLVLGKFLTVLTTAIATGGLSVLSMSATFLVARQFIAGLTKNKGLAMSISVDPSSVVMVFVMILPVAIFFAAAQLAISLYAKSFKEAQTYLSPLMFLVIIPAMASMAPGVELDLKLSLVPILNTSLVSKEIIAGTYNWTYIAVIFLSSCVYAAVALWVAVKLFQREEVIFRV